jgi:hypothetical protein
MAHTHSSEEADLWTNVSTVIETVSGFISDAYWLGSVHDTIRGVEVDTLGLSYEGLGIGMAIALLSSVGASYCHRVLNTRHQGPQKTVIINETTIPYPNPRHEIDPLLNAHVKLSWLEWLALLGDYLSHIGEIAGPLTFISKLAGEDKLRPAEKAAVESTAALLGIVGAFAGVRTCHRALLEQKKLEAAAMEGANVEASNFQCRNCC